MKRIIPAIHFLLITTAVIATESSSEEGVYMPWGEFKVFYREAIEDEIAERTAEPQSIPMVHVLERATYALTIAEDDIVRAEAQFSGTIVSGTPEFIRLLGPESVLTTSESDGGTVLCGPEGDIGLLPDAATRAFEVKLSFLLKTEESNGVQELSFAAPAALQNSLSVALPSNARVVDAPGIAGSDGNYHFGALGKVKLRYAHQSDLPLQNVVEVESISRIQIEEHHVLLDSYFQPLRTLPTPAILITPPGSRITNTSNKLEPAGGDANRYHLRGPSSSDEGFSVTLIVDLPPATGNFEISLPTIESNLRQQNFFFVEEPENGRVAISGESLITEIPVASLRKSLREHGLGKSHVMAASAGNPITLSIEHFKTVNAPPTILEAQYLYTSIDENGTILSVLILDAPAELGKRLVLKAVPDSELWSLTVNGVRQSLYAGSADSWVVPLAGGEPSHVELAVLRNGPKLGLQGQVDITVPGSGLPSKTLGIGLALPPRVEILSIEGPVKPAQADAFQPPAEFLGKPYYFSQSFYQGEGMNLSLAYKEPVKTN